MKTPSLLNFVAAFLGLLLVLAPFCSAQDESPDTGKEIEEEVTVLSVYKQGGWMMHILLVCSIGTIAVVVYCSIQISPKKLCPKAINDTLVRHLQARDVATAYAVCEANPNCLTRVVSSALLKVNFERDRANKDAMDQAAGEALDQEETRQMLWINYLNVFATIAPMIGLLGTVTGMIGSFADLKKGATDPNDFAGGIGEAMATTAGGLIVGIPAMFFYFFFRNRLLGSISEVQKRVSFLIDVVSGEVTLSDSDTPSD
jgi:biopolymer transport protein ExbB